MENVLFLQSEVKNPFEIYARMLADHPVYYDTVNRIWAVYSFDDCQFILNKSSALIPQHHGFTSESDEVKSIINNLARLSNDPMHAVTRKAASDLMMHCNFVDTTNLIHFLIGEPKRPATINWVEVSKKLPVFALLKGFNFSTNEIDLILSEIDNLVKIMLPTRTHEQNISVQKAFSKILDSIHRYTSKTFSLKSESEIHLYSSNLIGLLIQSYDAGRGLLCNAILHLDRRNIENDLRYFERAVKETLRFDPPVHNTRRVLVEDIEVNNSRIAKGENILIVQAAANRDPKRFKDPDAYTISRNENPQYLTFGSGPHRCLAEHFSIHLAASTLYYMYSKYNIISVLESEIQYEPRINVRLPVKMHVMAS